MITKDNFKQIFVPRKNIYDDMVKLIISVKVGSNTLVSIDDFPNGNINLYKLKDLNKKSSSIKTNKKINAQSGNNVINIGKDKYQSREEQYKTLYGQYELINQINDKITYYYPFMEYLFFVNVEKAFSSSNELEKGLINKKSIKSYFDSILNGFDKYLSKEKHFVNRKSFEDIFYQYLGMYKNKSTKNLAEFTHMIWSFLLFIRSNYGYTLSSNDFKNNKDFIIFKFLDFISENSITFCKSTYRIDFIKSVFQQIHKSINWDDINSNSKNNFINQYKTINLSALFALLKSLDIDEIKLKIDRIKSRELITGQNKTFNDFFDKVISNNEEAKKIILAGLEAKDIMKSVDPKMRELDVKTEIQNQIDYFNNKGSVEVRHLVSKIKDMYTLISCSGNLTYSTYQYRSDKDVKCNYGKLEKPNQLKFITKQVMEQKFSSIRCLNNFQEDPYLEMASSLINLSYK